jgi:uncharacterized protein (TIGR03067 family)
VGRYLSCKTIYGLFLALVLWVGWTSRSSGQEESPERTRIQGKWQLLSGEKGGKALTEQAVKNVELEFSGDRMTTRNGGREVSFPFRLIAGETPAAIDLDMDGGVGKGIYRLEGDRLAIVHSEAGEPRPTGFSTREGTPWTMMVLERRIVPEFANVSAVEAARIIDVPFQSQDHREMFGKLYLPESAPARAIVVYVQTAEGSTVDMRRRLSLTETFNYYDLYRDQLTGNGLGFFSYEGRGIRMGDSPPRFEQINPEEFNTGTLENKVEDILSAVAAVRGQPDCRDVPLYLMGASEGTLLAAEAASRAPDQVQALILYGVLALNMRENFRYIMSDGAFLAYREQFDSDGDGEISQTEFEADPHQYRQRVLRNAAFKAFDRNGDGSFTRADMELLTKLYLDAIDSENFKILQAWAKMSAAVIVPDNWFADHFAHPSLWTFLEQLDIPVGCFHGAMDTNTPIAAVRDLEEKAKAAGKTRMEFHYFDDLDHSLNIIEYFKTGTLPAGHAAIFEFIFRTAGSSSPQHR